LRWERISAPLPVKDRRLTRPCTSYSPLHWLPRTNLSRVHTASLPLDTQAAGIRPRCIDSYQLDGDLFDDLPRALRHQTHRKLCHLFRVSYYNVESSPSFRDGWFYLLSAMKPPNAYFISSVEFLLRCTPTHFSRPYPTGRDNRNRLPPTRVRCNSIGIGPYPISPKRFNIDTAL
jgi:hypothetical protein